MRTVIIGLILSFAAQGEIIEDLHLDIRSEVELGQVAQWTAARQMQGRDYKIEFKNPRNQKVLYRFLAPPASLLLQAEIAHFGEKDYLVTIWQDGNQVTALRVFDPLEGAKGKVFEKTTAGRIDYSVSGLGLEVTYWKADAKTMTLIKDTLNWQAVKK